MPSQPNVHIDRTPLEEDLQGKASFALTVTDPGRPEGVEDLAGLVAGRLRPYASRVRMDREGEAVLLRFETDLAPLSKYDMGDINQEALQEYLEEQHLTGYGDDDGEAG
jgi:hypothetical protein